ncbi:DNA polymerase IV [Methylocaldum szegediense]|uniref:DNA polymerase IV n=1 Tax=Methylocaldum szegediense TaxID=73780 RepID=UPI00295F0EAB|nr:DNA polymerase IV [Methylocaldum szegediense]
MSSSRTDRAGASGSEPIPSLRKIIHIDMDAFYAAVEQRDFPELRGKPVVVGGAPNSRGVVATCSYEARAFGIRSAMPAAQAYRLCPEAVFVRPRFDVYRAVSAQIRAILREFTDRVEAVSLDEAYLDVTASPFCQGSATRIAEEIKRRIRESTGLTASAGVSYNKFLAKIASDRDKPDGLCVITPEQGRTVIADLPIGAFHGIGKATEAKMLALGIRYGRDLERLPLATLIQHFGKAGEHYYRIARGIDERPVVPDRPRKSWGAETTFPVDLSDRDEMCEQLAKLAEGVLDKLSRHGLTARGLTVKVKYDNFELVTRGRTLDRPFRDVRDVVPHLADLLARTEAGRRKVRLLGVSFSVLENAQRPVILDLFTPD